MKRSSCETPSKTSPFIDKSGNLPVKINIFNISKTLTAWFLIESGKILILGENSYFLFSGFTNNAYGH